MGAQQDIAMSICQVQLLNPASTCDGDVWAFLVLPKTVSDMLPRRGRTSIKGTINGHAFQATLEPDGQLSHWLRVNQDLLALSGTKAGDIVTLEVAPMAKEPEPLIPTDFSKALEACEQASTTWHATTTIARVDWIHWVESAKQAKTRTKRIENACDMLAKGKGRVCCFDQSGFYSKSLSAPKAAE